MQGCLQKLSKRHFRQVLSTFDTFRGNPGQSERSTCAYFARPRTTFRPTRLGSRSHNFRRTAPRNCQNPIFFKFCQLLTLLNTIWGSRGVVRVRTSLARVLRSVRSIRGRIRTIFEELPLTIVKKPFKVVLVNF